MPPRHWKWRMRGAAIWMAEKARELSKGPDLILASDYVNLADLVALLPESWHRIPRAVYFHENQLTYPVSPGEKLDYHFGLINVVSALAARRLFFNSRYHLEEFFRELPGFLKPLPDFRPAALVDTLRARAEHLPLGCDLLSLDRFPPPERSEAGPVGPPAGVRDAPRPRPRTILWNHRWEFDKNPEDFFRALFEIKSRGLPFRLIVAGQRAQRWPGVFDEARERLREEIVSFGYLADRAEYARALRQADIVVSTAIHEFFGLAVVEAIYCGAYPLLPDRLAYPELVPRELAERHLFGGRESLTQRLRDLLEAPFLEADPSLAAHVAQYDWSVLAPRYDDALARVVEEG